MEQEAAPAVHDAEEISPGKTDAYVGAASSLAAPSAAAASASERNLCNDFKLGRCFRDRCRFSHGGASPSQERDPPRADAEGRDICADFLRGRCSRDRCRYSHSIEEGAEVPSGVGGGGSFGRWSGGDPAEIAADLERIVPMSGTGMQASSAAPAPAGAGDADAASTSGGGPATVQDDEVKVLEANGTTVQKRERYAAFEDASFPVQMLVELRKAGFPAPSQVQQYTWPLAMQLRDVIGVAATGSGKTLAFLLPAFAHVIKHALPVGSPVLLVLAPTRELAVQIEEEARRFGTSSGIRTACCYGGAPKHVQQRELRAGVHGVIGTPGRVNDFLEGGDLSLRTVVKLVLDEADRMLDMGFEPQIRRILAHVPADRQTLFFTATWPPGVRRLASEFLRDPLQVQIGNRGELKGNQDILQIVLPCGGQHDKFRLLREALQRSGIADPCNMAARGLVFCSTKRLCEQLSHQITQNGVPCTTIHGDKDQRAREAALADLKAGAVKLLVGTDVAARGLDIKGVTLVVNFDAPSSTEDYVHRIGRTGRAGHKGIAVTLVSDRDAHALPGIVAVMRKTSQAVSQSVERLIGNGGGSSRFQGGGFGRGRSRSRSRGRSAPVLSEAALRALAAWGEAAPSAAESPVTAIAQAAAEDEKKLQEPVSIPMPRQAVVSATVASSAPAAPAAVAASPVPRLAKKTAKPPQQSAGRLVEFVD